jgi:hypothetical protein
VSENRILRRIFGPTREEVVVGWRRMRNELHNLYTSPNIIIVMKSRRMRWAGHVANMGAMGMYADFWLEELKTRDLLEGLGIDGKIISE